MIATILLFSVPLILAAFSSTVRNVFAHVMGSNTPLAPGVDYGVVAGVVGKKQPVSEQSHERSPARS